MNKDLYLSDRVFKFGSIEVWNTNSNNIPKRIRLFGNVFWKL